ncbi:MAG TPA: beta-ketoacyl-ACP synthase II [Nitrospirales bacterium]
MRRVMITGMGAVTPLGIGVKALWEGLTTGRSAIGPITRFDATRHRCRIAAEVPEFDVLSVLDKKDTKRMDLFVQYAVIAAQEAMTDAALVLTNGLNNRTGVIVGTGMGGLPKLIEGYETLEKRGPRYAVPYMMSSLIPNMAAGWISMRVGARGPNSAVSTACAAGLHAIGEAFRLIQHGQADVMLAGGSESLITPVVFYGFDSLRALSIRNEAPQRASRPFDKERDGFVLGEGAGMLVLEEYEHARDRGAPLYGEVCGFGMTADAHHPTAPSPTGDGSARCMDLALADARLSTSDIDYICAHGTSTPLNDASETQAIKKVFGAHASRLSVSAIKSMLGHLLGASGAVATIATVLALREGIVPPTVNYETPDPECDLDYVPNMARRVLIKNALVNAFAFGGTNAVMVLRKFEGI